MPQANCKQVLDQKIADGVNELLQGVITNGTGQRAAIGRPAAGKTGTTNSRVSVWFVGYTPDLATAVWAGNPSPPPSGYPLSNRVIGGVYYGDVCGGDLWSARLDGGRLGPPRRDGPRIPYLVSFGLDARGRIDAVSPNGAVWRLRA